jgi:23S rRNA (cytosine1962-C5)-methyltransferase
MEKRHNAVQGYKRLNVEAIKKVAPGGILFTFSCSGGIPPDLFHKIVAGAGLDAQCDGYILERVGAAPDHPQTIYFPEGEYLKGLLILKR